MTLTQQAAPHARSRMRGRAGRRRRQAAVGRRVPVIHMRAQHAAAAALFLRTQVAAPSCSC